MCTNETETFKNCGHQWQRTILCHVAKAKAADFAKNNKWRKAEVARVRCTGDDRHDVGITRHMCCSLSCCIHGSVLNKDTLRSGELPTDIETKHTFCDFDKKGDAILTGLDEEYMELGFHKS